MEKKTNTPNEFDIKEFLQVCLRHWYYFAASLALALILAFLYMASTAPTYSSSACLIIKQDRRSGGSGIEASSMNFSNMGSLFAQQTNVYNEILAFKSPALMEDVVKRLGLRADYTTRKKLYMASLYGASLPVSLQPIDLPDNATFGLTIRYKDGSSVELCKMYNYIAGEKVEYSEPIVVALKDTVDTPVCKLVALPGISFYQLTKPFSDINLTYTSLLGATQRYSGGLSVTLADKEATAISMCQSDKSPQRAMDVLSALIAVYNEKWVGDRNQIAVSTSKFITERLAVIEEELGIVDSDISSFKSRNQLLDPALTGNMYLTQANKLQNDILELNNRLSMARYIRSYMASSASSGQLLPANSGIENSSIERQISDYNLQQLQRNNLVANSSVHNPVVIDMDASLNAMRGSILASIDNYIVTLGGQIETLQKTADQSTKKITASPKQAEYLTDIERQQKVKESLYLYLLQKREENELSQAFTAYNTRIITPPVYPAGATSPKRNTVMLLAILLGFALPAAWLYLTVMSNAVIHSRKDISGLKIPFIGEIPQAYPKHKLLSTLFRIKNKNENKIIFVEPHNRNAVNEAFRVARANLEFVCEGKGSNIIMATSFNVGSGKSFVSANLAISLALKDCKVCLVDLDLRKHSLNAITSVPGKGITEYLSGKVDSLDKILLKDVIVPGLDFVPVGSVPPNPTELLYKPAMDEMMRLLRDKYDYVILDCPPIDIVADTLVASKYADHTVFVVRADLMKRELLPEVDLLYEGSKYPGMVLLLNGVEIETSYGRYGSYGYGYGYIGSSRLYGGYGENK